MSQIEHSSAEIGKTIGVIDEIAFHANLLTLNAGFESVRAAEKGQPLRQLRFLSLNPPP